MPRRRVRVGDVCQFALRDGRFAYGRIYRDASIAIYRTITNTPGSPPLGERDFRFVVGIYDDVPGRSDCPVIARDPFLDSEDDWPPACKVVDPITGRIRVYHRGEILAATSVQNAEELEPAAVWDLGHLLARLESE